MLMTALTNAYENKEIDFKFRGQALGLANTSAGAGTGPATWYVCLFTAAGDDAAAGTEVSGGGYARVPITSSLANWAGTQGAGTTAVSSGTSGITSNNGAVTFPTPTGTWGQVVEFGLADSLTGGIVAIRSLLGTPKTINNGDPGPVFAPSTLSFQCDN
jgi:hypothetical protein